jgi:hypothetical protein
MLTAYVPTVLEVKVQGTIRTPFAPRAMGDAGQESVKPDGEVAVRLTFPLKFSLDVNVTFTTALVWPRFKSRPEAEIEKSPTLTVKTIERLRDVAERVPFIVTV